VHRVKPTISLASTWTIMLVLTLICGEPSGDIHSDIDRTVRRELAK